MALILVHKIMIGTALAFCLLFTVRALWVGDALLGVFFGAVTVVLGLYFRWFVRNKAEQILSAGTEAGDDN
jgi:hypothetical protein